jgi:hypothetical protein
MGKNKTQPLSKYVKNTIMYYGKIKMKEGEEDKNANERK